MFVHFIILFGLWGVFIYYGRFFGNFVPFLPRFEKYQKY